METNPQGVLIVSVRGIENIEGNIRRISEIEGVVDVQQNNLTRKLLIRYEGNQARMREIELELKSLLKDGDKGDRHAPRHPQRRRRL